MSWFDAPDAQSFKDAERRMRFAAADRKQAEAWQEQARKKLRELLRIDDLFQADLDGPDGKPRLDFKVEVQAVQKPANGRRFTRYDLELNSTATRRIPVVLTVPDAEGKHPAVVCIHGHDGSRNLVYDPTSIYQGFALELANRGYVTIATEIGQHDVHEPGRTLVGERLWDLMRCVSYLTTRPEVDAGRIGCAGLSLGGEMATHLGAGDTRVKAIVVSGGLTTVPVLLKACEPSSPSKEWRGSRCVRTARMQGARRTPCPQRHGDDEQRRRRAVRTQPEGTLDLVDSCFVSPRRRVFQTRLPRRSLPETAISSVATPPLFRRAANAGGCGCWRFPGYIENFDLPDLYCLMAPRWVMSQNGEREDLDCPAFLPKWAKPAMEKEVLPCYRLFGKPERAVLRAHPGRHVFEVSTAIPFLDRALKPLGGSLR